MDGGPLSSLSLRIAASILVIGSLLAFAAPSVASSGPPLTSFSSVRSIPSPVNDLLDRDEERDRSTTQAASDAHDPDQPDERLEQHEVPSSSGGLDLGTLGWVAGFATASLAGLLAVAMLRTRGDPRPPEGPGDASKRAGAPASGRPDERDPEAAFLADAPPPGVDGVLEIAQACIAEDDWEAAARWFETAIALRPRLTVAHFCLGLSLEQLGRDEEALEAFAAAEELGGTGPAPAYRQARLYARMGETDAAMARLGQALRAEPELSEDAADDPVFEPLKDHPRFLALLGEL